MLKETLYILEIVTTSFLLFFALFLVSFKRHKRPDVKILSLFLVANALYIIIIILRENNLYNMLQLLYLQFIVSLFLGPLLHIYSQIILVKNFQLKFQLIAYHLSGIALLAIFTIFFFKSPFSLSVIMNIQLSIYLISIFILLFRYRKEFRNYHASDDKVSILLIVLAGFWLMWLIDLTAFILFINIKLPLIIFDLFSIASLTINLIFAISIRSSLNGR